MAKTQTKPQSKITIQKAIPWILVIAGTIGVILSGIISWEKLQLAQNPHYIPSCNLNPVIGCGAVTQSKQAEAFVIPNPFIGLAAFAIVATTGMTLLAGAKLKKWYWIALNLGTVFGIGFIHWLFFESVYRIHSLCIYCMGVWVITIGLFIYVTLYNLRVENIKTPASLKKIVGFIDRHHVDIYILWLLIIAFFVIKHFWYYYGPHFHL